MLTVLMVNRQAEFRVREGFVHAPGGSPAGHCPAVVSFGYTCYTTGLEILPGSARCHVKKPTDI